ncbi:hypothetical protein [Escherichia coli]|nr:hypothetical protein [Escherichia coli]
MSDHNPLTLKLNLREKIAYGMGDVGSNLMLCTDESPNDFYQNH